MKKTPTPRWLSNRAMIWMAALGLLCLGLLIWVIVNAVLVAQDRARFAEVSQEKSLIASRLADSLGNNVISTREQDECFNAEQGPWDNGNLWCQVASIIRIKQSTNFEAIGRQYVQAAQESGRSSSGSGSGPTARFWYKDQGMVCSLSAIDSEGHETGAATSDSLIGGYRPSVAVACADRARASYYPYSN